MVKQGIIHFTEYSSNLALIVNVCSCYVMYSCVGLKTPLDTILFTPTHIFLTDEWPFLEILKESELFL